MMEYASTVCSESFVRWFRNLSESQKARVDVAVTQLRKGSGLAGEQTTGALSVVSWGKPPDDVHLLVLETGSRLSLLGGSIGGESVDELLVECASFIKGLEQ